MRMDEPITRDEFMRLGDRVSVLEREVEGEKLVSRYILEQTRRNGDDLAALRTRVARLETELGDLRGEVGQIRIELGDLRRDLPGIVADVMRQVLREARP